MPVDNQTQLSRIANFAYGSGTFEGTSGGKGNIGLINGHVVKFNTHYSERGGAATNAMLKSSDNLRLKLNALAGELLYGKLGENSKLASSELASIRKKLGLSETGQQVVSTGLLDRKVVASVIRQIDARTGANSFRDAQTGRYSSEGLDTRFSAVTAGLYGEEFMSKKGDALMAAVDTKMSEKGLGSLSEESRTIVKSVLRRSVEALYAEKGVVTEDDVVGAGSTLRTILDSIVVEGSTKRFPLYALTLALTLPPKDVNAFLKAVRLVPTEQYGALYRFASLSSKLAKLPPSKFTPENLLRIAFPERGIPQAVKDKTKKTEPISETDLNELKVNLDEDAADEVILKKKPFTGQDVVLEKYVEDLGDVDNEKYRPRANQVLTMISAGVSPKDVRAWFGEPSKFSLAMLPKSFFLTGDNSFTETVGGQLKRTAEDIARQHHAVSILRKNGIPYTMPDELRSTEDVNQEKKSASLQNFGNEIKDLCGKENVAQQRLVLLFLSQNSQGPETFMNVSFNDLKDPPQGARFILKADPATGDILVSKTIDRKCVQQPADVGSVPPELKWGMSVTIRFGKDGTQTLVDLQESHEVCDLVPKDGNGNPMVPEDGMINNQLV